MSAPPNVREAVPFFGVSDMEASVRYYVDGLGFEITLRWEPEGRLRWCRLQHGGAGLMLQEYLTEGHGGRRPEGKLGQGVSVCFLCEDALALYRGFRARGIAASRPLVGNAMWVTSLTDPDGYRLDFESPTDAPEESVLPDDDA
jgi:lactoylglutathione lyase